MKEINFKDFKVIPILSSIKRIDMSDEEYFSKTYRDYVSNSRLKNINPIEGGSPSLYKNPPHFSTQSLVVGSAVHERLLQPESFELAPKMGRPTAKLGNCIDAAIKYRKQGYSIYESIIKGSNDADYYAGRLTYSRIKSILKAGLPYYFVQKNLKGTEIVLSDSDHDTVTSCIKSVENNSKIINTLYPETAFGDKIPSYNEDAFFMDYIVMYKDKATILKYKMKIDNWTIDTENKVLTLNDLKTSYKPASWFMNPEYGSMYHYHYYRQFALYGDILQLYCMKEYGYTPKIWDFKANVLVVSTSDPYESQCFPISDNLIKKGRREYMQLLKRVAYYEIFGYEEEVKFI